MKLFLMLAAVVNLNSVFAQDCKQGLCVGDNVIDSYSRIGNVIGFPEDGMARYKVDSYKYDEKISSLSKEVSELNGISSNVKVIDEYSRVGVANRVFADGRTQYTYSSSKYVSKSLSPEIKEENFVRAGTVIIDEYSRVGTCLAVFKNKKVQYQYSDSQYVSSSVSAETDVLNGLEKDMTAIDEYSRVGVVAHVFRDGRYQYKYSGSYYVTKSLSPKIENLGLLKENIVAIDEYSRIGVVVDVFRDGRVSYKYSGSNYISKNLKAKVEAFNEIGSGAIVLDEYSRLGTVLHAFEDGRYSYSYSGSNYVSKSLSQKVDELNGLTSGLVVVDEYNRVGKLKYLFKDGRAYYNYSGSYYVGKASNLSKEVNAHPKYVKGNLYSTDSYQVGTAVLFFENKKVELESLNGGKFVQTRLFDQVSSIDVFAPDYSAVDSQARDIVIKMVFENGTLAYQLKNPKDKDEEQKFFGGKIYSFFLEKDEKILAELIKEEQKSWILELANSIAEKEGISLWPSYSPYISVISPDHMSELKKELLERLFDEPEIIENKILRKKVRDYLSN